MITLLVIPIPDIYIYMTEVKTTVEGSVISGIVGTQKCADSGSVDPMENDECVICLDAVKKRGRIECCDHKFCFECIKKWSKVSSDGIRPDVIEMGIMNSIGDQQMPCL